MFRFLKNEWHKNVIGWRAFKAVLRETPDRYWFWFGIEQTRAAFLRDVAAGHTPEQWFVLLARGGGHNPGTPDYEDMKTLVQEFARDAGVSWSGGWVALPDGKKLKVEV